MKKYLSENNTKAPDTRENVAKRLGGGGGRGGRGEFRLSLRI